MLHFSNLENPEGMNHVYSMILSYVSEKIGRKTGDGRWEMYVQNNVEQFVNIFQIGYI